jgi:DNA-binding transcriptional regulator YiaG
MDGTEIRSLREVAGLSQGDLAAIMRVAPKTISWWEYGKTRPSRAMAGRLQALRGVVEELDNR